MKHFRPRDGGSATRLAAVVEFCQTPRTRAELVDHFGADSRYAFALFNGVKRGLLRNLCTGKRNGRYQAIAAEPITRATAANGEVGLDLQRAWR